MRFVGSLLVAFVFGLLLLPNVVFATPEEDLTICQNNCQIGNAAAINACNTIYSIPAEQQACISSIPDINCLSCEVQYRDATEAAAEAAKPQTATDIGPDSYDNLLRDGIIFANMRDDCTNAMEGDCVTRAECEFEGQCSLDQVLQVFVNVTIFILGISGSAILLMFVYGGFLWVTSRGDAKRIEKGKDTVTHAVVGFAIILLSYSMINFLIASLAGDVPSSTIDETIKNAGDNISDL